MCKLLENKYYTCIRRTDPQSLSTLTDFQLFFYTGIALGSELSWVRLGWESKIALYLPQLHSTVKFQLLLFVEN